ncbi:MAG: CARDB domain-containing protein, partial [Thermoplasmatota archaeon]
HHRSPEPGEETAMELVVSSYGRGAMVLAPNDPDTGPSAGYHPEAEINDCNWSTATPVICNMDIDKELEIAFPMNMGEDSGVSDWKGGILVTDRNLSVIGGIDIGDEGSAVIGSPAVADIDGMGYDEWRSGELDLVFGTAGGLLNVLSLNGSVLNWSFDSGFPILSSPAICDVDIDMKLEIVFANEDGRIYMMDGDPSDGIDEGVPYPYDGIDHDVLWVYHTDIPTGISSPVVADIDLDGMLEVVIGASEDGLLLCIAAGGRSMKGQEDWTTFHGINDRTGYYSRPVKIGVDIYPSWIGDHRCDPLVKSIAPGKWTKFNLTVELCGWGVPEIDREMVLIVLNETSVRKNWSAWIDTPPDRGNLNPDYVKLASTETAQIVLWVKAPWEGVIGEMARISVDAILKSDPFIEDTATTLSVLDLYVDYEMEFVASRDNDPNSSFYNKKVRTVDTGETAIQILHIRNKGNMNDTYTLTLSEPPSDLGWEWYFEETGNLTLEVSLTAPYLSTEFGGITEKYIQVLVHVPSNGYGGMTFPLRAIPESYVHSVSDVAKYQYPDTVYLMIREVPSLNILLTKPFYDVEPGGTVNLETVITNNGNIWDMFVNLSIWDNANITTVLDHIEPFVLNMSERVHRFVNLTISPFARSDIKYPFAVIVRNISYNAQDSTALYLNIAPISGLDAEITLEENIIQSGQTIEGEINLTSLSNFIDPVTLSCNVHEADISVKFLNSSGFPVERIEPEPFSSSILKLWIETDRSLPEGRYTLDLVFSSDSGHFINETIELTFRNDGWIIGGFFSATPVLHRSVDYGERISISLSFKNNRSIAVTMELSIASKFIGELLSSQSLEDWVHAGFTGASFTTEPADTVHIHGSHSLDLSTRNIENDLHYDLRDPNGNISDVRSVKIFMEPYSTVYLDMEVMIRTPNGEEVIRETGFKVMARERYWGIGLISEATLDVRYPDLDIIESPTFMDSMDGEPDKINPNEGFELVFKVVNSGNASSGPVSADLAIDGEKYGRFLLPELAPGERVEIRFGLTLPEGDHHYTFEVDAENTVHESRDQFASEGAGCNNVISGTIEIQGERETPWLPMISSGAAIALISAAVIGYLLFMKRRITHTEE